MPDLSCRYPNSPRSPSREDAPQDGDDAGGVNFRLLRNMARNLVMTISTSERRCCIPGGRKWTVCPRIASKSIHSGRLSDHRDYEDWGRSMAGVLTVVPSVNRGTVVLTVLT